MTPFERLYQRLFGSQRAASSQARPPQKLPTSQDRSATEDPVATATATNGAPSANGAVPVKEKSELTAGWTREGRHPILDQQSAFHNRFHDLAKARRHWQIAALLSLLLALVVLVGFVRMAGRSHVQPYVIAVGRSGIPLPIGKAKPLAEGDPRITRAVLVRAIRNLRTVVESPSAQRALLDRALLYVTEDAKDYIQHWFTGPGNNPMALAGEIRRTVAVESILQMPDAPGTWRIRWIERTRRDGSWQAAEWEAIVTVDHALPPSEKARLMNPTGLYITDLSWTKTYASE